MAWAWAPKTSSKLKSDEGDATRGAARAKALLQGELALPARVMLALASALLCALSVRSLASPLLTLVALAPLFVATRGVTPGVALGLGWLAASVASFIGYAFVPTALSATSALSPPVAWAALAAFALFRGAWLGLAFGAAAFARQRQQLLIGALLLTVLELALPNPLPFAFGTPLVMWPPIAQIASVLGASGLTLIAALFSAGLAALLPTGRRNWGRTWGVIAVGAAAPTLAAIFGLARLSGAAPPDAELNATLVHTMRDAQRPGPTPVVPAGRDLVVLPESAIAEPLPAGDSDALGRELLGPPASPTLFGLSERTADGRLRNVALLVEPHSPAPSGRYEKRALLPFAEAAFEPGRTTDTITIGGVPLSVEICSEELFSGVVRAGVREHDARVIVALGNDAWFGESFAAELHLLAARVRAIESGRSVLRASNGGVSAAIDPYGRLLARTREPGPVDVRVPALHATPPFLRWGNALLWAFLAAALGVALLAPRRAEVAGSPSAR